MYDSELKAFSFMRMSNREMLLTEKDLNALELNFLARPTLEFVEVEGDHDDHRCQIAPLQEEDDHVLVKQEDKEVQEKVEEEDKCRILVSSLKIKLPNSIGEFKVEEEEEEEEEEKEDGFKTPTSLDQKIPPVLQCPPAPRKPKSRPLMITTKRKLPSVAVQQRRIVLHNLSNEIEAMFPPVLLADLGNKIKKVRQEKK